MFEIIELNALDDSFLQVVDNVYANDPFYIASSLATLRTSIEREEFSGRQALFVARDDALTVGRLVARISPSLSDEDNLPLGMISHFEATEDQQMIHALLDRAMAWFKGHDIQTVIGPMDGDTWHKYRFNVGPWKTPPFMMEPYNAPYYAPMWEAYGFEIDAGYHSLYVDDAGAAAQNLKKFYKHVLKRGFTFRNFDLKNYDSELSLFYRLSCSIFAQNYLYNPISEDAFKDLYANARSILDPKLVWFAFDNAGKPAGFVFCFPDYFQAQLAMGGKSHILAKARFLMNRGRADTLNIKSLGSTPEHRGSGLGPALMYQAFQCGLDSGFKKANLCLIKDGNPSGRLDGGQGRVLRRYNLYRYSLRDA